MQSSHTSATTSQDEQLLINYGTDWAKASAPDKAATSDDEDLERDGDTDDEDAREKPGEDKPDNDDKPEGHDGDATE